jgi:hypothetical protein
MTTPASRAPVRHFRDELHARATRHEWRASRALWAVMALAIAAALAGVSGSGPLARADATAPLGAGRAELNYPRFARFHAPTALVVRVDAPETAATTLRISLSPELVSQVDVRETTPQPGATSLGPDGGVYEWQVQDWSAPISVQFSIRPDDHGRVGGRVSIAAGEGTPAAIDFTTWVLP